jgi:hypothetical protein
VDRLTKPTEKKSNSQEKQLLTRSMIELHNPAKEKESQNSPYFGDDSSTSSPLSFRDPRRISAVPIFILFFLCFILFAFIVFFLYRLLNIKRLTKLRSELALRKRGSEGGSLIASQRQTLLDEVRRKGGDITDVMLTAPSRLNTDKWEASSSTRSNPSFLDNRNYRRRKAEIEKENKDQIDEDDHRPDPFSVAAWEEVPRSFINLTDAPVLGRGSNGAGMTPIIIHRFT